MINIVPEIIPRLRRVRVPGQSPTDAVVTSLSALVDRSLMRAVSYIVEKRLLPREVDLDMLRDSIHAILDTGLIDNPEAFFAFARELESSCDSEMNLLQTLKRRRINGGRVYRRKLGSGYQHFPQMPIPGAALEQSDAILFEHWVHSARPARGSVIVLHGFAMGWPIIDARAMSARQWFDLGFNVVLLTLPDHGPRRASGALFSGQSFTVPHAVRLAAAVRRAIHEIFELKNWLRSQDDAPVGLVGMSLGGYLASLCAGLSDDFDFLVPLVPPACMGDLAWRVYRDTGHHRAGQDPTLTEDNMRRAFYIHSPLAHPRKIAKERLR
jgi:pimeloyl-ACP methyl ester carboxylesterase